MQNTSRNPYLGHPSQLLRVNDYRIMGGFAADARATDVHNGKLCLTVLADKGMDFPYLSYKGVNLGFVAPSGLVGSSYYDDRGTGFLRGFFAGLLTTCGLTHMGAPSDENGAHYGMHGRVNNTPAEEYAARLVEDENGSRAVLGGTMRQGALFGENLTMRREISVGCGEKGFSFTDTVTNRGFRKEQHMLLYHFNFGYPLLDEGVELLFAYSHAEARDAHAETGFDDRLRISKPVAGYREMCYFYKLLRRPDGRAIAGVYNHALGLGVALEFDAMLLDCFTEWKMMGEGAYVLGLEPGNATPLGVPAERALGHIKYLEPWESRSYRFTIRILEGGEDLAALREELRLLREAGT